MGTTPTFGGAQRRLRSLQVTPLSRASLAREALVSLHTDGQPMESGGKPTHSEPGRNLVAPAKFNRLLGQIRGDREWIEWGALDAQAKKSHPVCQRP